MEHGLDIYISVDVETDGPVPGSYSMLSIGLCVAGTFDGHTFRSGEGAWPVEPLYLELKPTGSKVDREALAINGLDRDQLTRDGLDPSVAMQAVTDWIERAASGGTPVMVAYPLAFDWSFVSWYFAEFGAGQSPFGHSRAIDIRTMYLAKARSLFGQSGKAQMPDDLRPTRRHTHNALDDALEQAELFSNVFEWDPALRPSGDFAEGHRR